MTIYNPGIPLPNDLPSDSQGDIIDNFGLLNQYFGVNHTPFGNVITNITNANPAQITSPNHGLSTGNTIVPSSVQGLLLGATPTFWVVNGNSYSVTVIDANNFTIPADTTNLTLNPPYTPNTGDFTCSSLPYGYHTQISLSQPLQSDPNLASPIGSVYSKLIDSLSQLFFQNGNSSADATQLTKLKIVQGGSGQGNGIITPWGYIFNFGRIMAAPTAHAYQFPIPFTSQVFSLVGSINSFLTSPNQMFSMQVNSVNGFTAVSYNSRTPYLFYLAIGI